MAAAKYTAEQRDKLLSEYRASGQKQNQWCKENGISKSTLSKWLKDAAGKTKTEQNWISTQIVIPQSRSTLVIEIGSCKIKVDESFSKQLLAEIIKVLVAVC